MWDTLTHRRNLIAKLLVCVLALGLEAGSAWVLWQADSSSQQTGLFLLLHLTACLLLALAFADLLPSQQCISIGRTTGFVFLVCFFIPWFGMPGIIGGLLPALWWPKKHSDKSHRLGWSYLSIPPLPDHSPTPRKPGAIHYGVASIAGILQGASNLGQRQRGVLATLRLRDIEAIPLLQRALRDSEDDVRLLAYALLDRKEHAITARIRQRQKCLADADADNRLSHHSAIAQDCWELIHLGLVQGEVKRYLLMTARKHTEDALVIRPQNAGLQLLLGKLLLRLGEADLAYAALRRAEQQGMDATIVSPYLAEVEFSKRQFSNPDAYAGMIQVSAAGQALHGVVAYRREDA